MLKVYADGRFQPHPRASIVRTLLACSLLLTCAAAAGAQGAAAPDAAIRSLLTQQAADWNRGDLDAFAHGYKRSPDILFIGRTVRRGYDEMLAGYKRAYPTAAAMGKLSFSQLAVQPLDARFATATGHYHLDRDGAHGGGDDGHFLLVLEHTAEGWRIVRDDTTEEPRTAAK